METKKIIITGGATRIGAAIAKSLVSYNTKISIHFNKSKKSALKLKKELEEIGAKAYLLKADLNNSKQTQNLIKNAYKKMKGLDCLINNASIFENDNLENFSEKSFTKHMNINLKSPAILTQNFKKLIKKKENINEKNINKYLHTKNVPDPDILIRTGNTKRLSNFLLWQIAYTEIFFEKKLWPEFNENDYTRIIKKFKKIKRNFGNI